jgi:hypothetical protein
MENGGKKMTGHNLSYLLLRSFCKVPQSWQVCRRERCIRLLVFYICKMNKSKLSSGANFDLIAEALTKAVGGGYPTFQGFVGELRTVLLEMSSYERLDIMIVLRQFYDECGENKLQKK